VKRALRGRLGLYRLACLMAVICGAGLAGLYPVRGAWAQEIRGVVLLPDSVPVAKAVVQLHRVTEQTGALVDSATTDAYGRFVFSFDDEVESGTVYLGAARHDGILYWGEPVHSTMSQDALDSYTVLVYDTLVVAGPDTGLRTAIRHVVVTPAMSGLQVEEIIDVEGLPDRTVVGEADTLAVWIAPLASGAHGVVPSAGGVAAEDLIVTGDQVGYVGPLPPSGIRVVIQYVIPSPDYVLSLLSETGRLELLVMPVPGLDLTVSGLEESAVSGDMRVPVRRFSGLDLAAGSSISVRATIEQPGKRSAWIWFIVSLALGTAAVVSVKLSSRQRHRPS